MSIGGKYKRRHGKREQSLKKEEIRRNRKIKSKLKFGKMYPKGAKYRQKRCVRSKYRQMAGLAKI
jgi:hypothetical protein